MSEFDAARDCKANLLTVGEALRPSMPRVADLMDEAAFWLDKMDEEIIRIFRADR